MSDTNKGGAPLAERTILVHREGEEGAIQINAMTGVILTATDERPPWADGLAAALTAERLGWYTSRLGEVYAKEHFAPEALAFEDLGWLAIDEEGEPVELEADIEHRMNVISEYNSITRFDDLTAHDNAPATKGEIASATVDMNHIYTEDEAHALEQATHANIDAATKTGTDK